MNENESDNHPDVADESAAHAKFEDLIAEAAEEDRSGSPAAAQLAVLCALQVAVENFERDDSQFARLIKRKTALEEARDWPSVIEVQKEIIRHSEVDLPRQKPDAPAHYAPTVACEPWSKLSEIHNLVGDHEAALAAADRAVEYARKSDMSPMLVLALAQRAHTLAKMNRWEEARESGQAALDALDPELPFTGPLLARYRLQLGRYHARLNDLESARRELEFAEPHLEPNSCQRDSLHGAWHELQAEIHFAEGNLTGAIAEMETAAGLREAAAPKFMGGEEYASARTLLTLQRLEEFVLESGDPSAAPAVRHRIEALRQRFGWRDQTSGRGFCSEI